MNTYELTYILPGDLAEGKQKEISQLVEKGIKDAGGKVDKVNKWGKKELRYPIQKQRDGIYFLLDVSLPEDQVRDIDRSLQTDEQILRHLIVKSAGAEKVIKKAKKVVKSPEKTAKKKS